MKDFYVSKSHQDNVAIARELLADNVGVTRTRASIFGLTGDLGSGKTTWTRGMVDALGGNPDDVQSPTFVLMRDYDLEDNLFKFKTLHHLDAYRLNNAKEFNALKLQKWLADPQRIFVIEWWRQVESAIDDPVTELSFETINDYTKTITITKI